MISLKYLVSVCS